MADRRRERRRGRDERREAAGDPGADAVSKRSTTIGGWPLLTDGADQPTMILRPSDLDDWWGEPGPPRAGAPPPGHPQSGLPEDSPERRRRLGVSTAIFSLATGLSRILGLVRESVAAYYFGAGGKINAFTVAFQVPNLARALLADAALSSAFVPVFSELLERGEKRRAWRVASSLFWLMLLGLSALTALYILLAPWVMRIFGDPGADRALAAGLSRVLFPLVVLLGLSGIVVGILNTYDEFAVPALTPVVWNLAIIGGLAIGVPQAHSTDTKLYVYAGSILGATAIQTFLPMPWLRGHDDRLRVVLDWRDPAVWRVLRLMLPVTLGLGLINFNAFVDTFFASRFIDPRLAPTAIQKAFLLYMLPQGMFSVAIATVLFPSLSRLAARGDLDGFRATVARGLRQIAFLLVPAAVVSAVLAEPIVRIVYQRGQFTADQTAAVAPALAAFAAGLAFNGAMLLLNRGFFSLQSNWVPTVVALVNLVLNGLLDLAFYRLGIWGIPLSTAVVNVAGTWALLVLLQRRIGRLDDAATVGALTKIVGAGIPLALVSFFVWLGIDAVVGRSFPGQVVSLGLALLAGTATYLLLCRALRVAEVEALSAIGNRLRGRG